MLRASSLPRRALLATHVLPAAADALAWRRLVTEPMAEGGAAAAQAWRLLGAVLKPLMWRNTKGVVAQVCGWCWAVFTEPRGALRHLSVGRACGNGRRWLLLACVQLRCLPRDCAQEFHLPARSLKPTWLHFQPGERAFYEQVVEQTRKAREELLSFRRGLQQPASGDEEEPTSPAAARTRQRQQAKQSERLQLAAVDNLTQASAVWCQQCDVSHPVRRGSWPGCCQARHPWPSIDEPHFVLRVCCLQLRLACIHPQVGGRWWAGVEGQGDSPAISRGQERGNVPAVHPPGLFIHRVAAACILSFPLQLTKSWRAMAAEGQLGVGATLSMEEIMQRLVETAQYDLQVLRGRAAPSPGQCGGTSAGPAGKGSVICQSWAAKALLSFFYLSPAHPCCSPV